MLVVRGRGCWWCAVRDVVAADGFRRTFLVRAAGAKLRPRIPTGNGTGIPANQCEAEFGELENVRRKPSAATSIPTAHTSIPTPTTSIPTSHLVSCLRTRIERHGQRDLAAVTLTVTRPERIGRYRPKICLRARVDRLVTVASLARRQPIVSGSQHGHGGCHCIGLQPQGQNSDRASRRATEPASRPTSAKRSSAGTKNVRRKPSAATSIPTSHHQHPDRAPRQLPPILDRAPRTNVT